MFSNLFHGIYDKGSHKEIRRRGMLRKKTDRNEHFNFLDEGFISNNKILEWKTSNLKSKERSNVKLLSLRELRRKKIKI